MPKVSVIIPTYNRECMIREAMESVLNQTYQDFEIIVVDDGSTDATKEVVSSVQDSRICYVYQNNSGVAAARNKGIAISCGEYIALLDSDDAWLPEFLSLMVEHMENNAQVALAGSDCFIYDERFEEIICTKWHGTQYETIEPRDAERYPLRYLLRGGCFISPQATLIRSSVLDKIGYFDETLRTHEDIDLFIRIVREYPIKLLDIPLVKFRRHDHGLQSDRNQMYQDDIAVIGRILSTCRLTRAEKRAATRRLARIYFYWGWYAFYLKDHISGRRRLFRAIRINPWDRDPYKFLYGYFLFVATSYLATSVLPKFPRPMRTLIKGIYHRVRHNKDKVE